MDSNNVVKRCAMSIKRKKQLSIILILSVISALMFSQPVKASDDNFENDWKYLCDWVDWDGEKLVNRSLEMYQMKSYDDSAASKWCGQDEG